MADERHPPKKSRVTLTKAELRKRTGRSEPTLSAWRKGARGEPGGRLDPLGDPHLTGDFVGKPGSKAVRYETTNKELAALTAWLETSGRLQRRAAKPPTYIKAPTDGGGKGNEHVTPDDLLTIPLDIDGLGPCRLFLRNRGWLHVFDSQNRVNRVRASEHLIAELTELSVGDWWPFSDEDALRLVYGLEFPEPVKTEEGGSK